MGVPPLNGIHYIKIPVVDLPAAVDWYGRVFGFTVSMEFPDEDGVVRGVAGAMPGVGEHIAMRENPRAAAGCEGFDPFIYGVDGPGDLEAWAAHLDELGIDHSPVIEASVGWLLVFDDLNGIEIHLYTALEHGRDHSNRAGYGRRIAPAED